MIQTTTFKDLADAITEFEALLNGHGITIEPGTLLEGLALHIYQLFENHERPELQDPALDIRPWLSGIVGMNEVARLLLSVREHRDFAGQVVPHLKLLNEGSPPQNTRASVMDDASNKIFELACAAAAMRMGHGVELEDPKDSGSREPNPDVIVITGAGTRWGIACKCLHSQKGQTIVDNVKKGASQIEGSRCDRGVVAVNLKNVLRHERFWRILNESEYRDGKEEPRFDCWFSAQAAFDELLGEVNAAISACADPGVMAELEAVWPENQKSIPGILFYAHTTCGVLLNGKPVPTSLGFFNMRTERTLPDLDLLFLEQLNLGMRAIGS